MEDQIDKLEGEDDDTSSSADGDNSQNGDGDSFLQVKKHDEDEENEHAEMARMEDQIDKLEGEDDDTSSSTDGSSDGVNSQDGNGDSFLQVKHDEDEENEHAEMARMEDQI